MRISILYENLDLKNDDTRELFHQIKRHKDTLEEIVMTENTIIRNYDMVVSIYEKKFISGNFIVQVVNDLELEKDEIQYETNKYQGETSEMDRSNVSDFNMHIFSDNVPQLISSASRVTKKNLGKTLIDIVFTLYNYQKLRLYGLKVPRNHSLIDLYVFQTVDTRFRSLTLHSIDKSEIESRYYQIRNKVFWRKIKCKLYKLDPKILFAHSKFLFFRNNLIYYCLEYNEEEIYIQVINEALQEYLYAYMNDTCYCDEFSKFCLHTKLFKCEAERNNFVHFFTIPLLDTFYRDWFFTWASQLEKTGLFLDNKEFLRIINLLPLLDEERISSKQRLVDVFKKRVHKYKDPVCFKQRVTDWLVLKEQKVIFKMPAGTLIKYFGDEENCFNRDLFKE